MKLTTIILIWMGILTATLVLQNSANGMAKATLHGWTPPGDPLKKAALNILDTKCNVCHRKQNPFMIFNEKNMVRRAPKIYKMVYLEQRMPKGNEIKLNNDEYTTLEKWLFTQEIF